MSASREKKKRQEFLASGAVDPKAAREAEQKAAERRSTILYSTLAVVFVVVAVFLLVYNSGVIQRNKTAVTIDGEKYSVADVSFYYQTSYQNFLNTTEGYYAAMLGMLNTQQSLKTQNSFTEGQTWDDYFKEQAVNTMKFVHAAKTAAKAENMSLDEEDLATVNATLESMKTQASSAGYSYKAYLTLVFGSTMTPSIYEENLKDYMLASKYAVAYQDSLSFSAEEVQAYYEENQNTYDLVNAEYVTISGAPETKTDDEGNTIEATDEERAAAMAAAKETADALLAAYEDGSSLKVLADEQDLTYSVNEAMSYSSNVYGEWLFDTSRSSGDAEVLVDETNNRYYVAVFHSRERDEAPGYDVRHILVTADNLELGEDEEATDEMILAKAEEILASWDGTEDGFAALANEYSRDTGSNTNGGLYEGVVKGAMVTNFNNWCYEEGRKAGDTGIVSSSYGQHIMYFVGYSDDVTLEYWYDACNNMLISNAFNEWQTGLTDSVTAEVSESGMKAI